MTDPAISEPMVRGRHSAVFCYARVMPDHRGFPTKEEFALRDRAIREAAARGLSWTEQALAGLAALPPRTQGVGKKFTYMLTCFRSPLREPKKYQAWSQVFRQAQARGVLEHTGRLIQVEFGTYRKCWDWQSEYVLRGSPNLNERMRENRERWRRYKRVMANERARLRRRVQPQPKRCAACGEVFTPKRFDAVTCSNRCRQKQHRQRHAAGRIGFFPAESQSSGLG
jgi:hypothetical protein